MKLFQQLLVAGASLSFLAPIAAQASDIVNLEEMNSYSRSTKKKSSKLDSNTFVNNVNEDLAITKSRVDGLDSGLNSFEAGSFSSTTSMDGKAIVWVGGIDGANDLGTADNQSVQTGYTYTCLLYTSPSPRDSR